MSDLSEKVQANILEAQVFSRKHLVLELDFSPQSLQELESHIDTLEYAIRGGKSDENIEMLTRTWGCYLGECLRRPLEGEWIAEQADPHQGVAVRANDHTLFPLEQVRKRLVEGESFNLADYFLQATGMA